MRRNRLPRLAILGVAGLVVLSGCSNGGDPRSLGPVPTASPTTLPETTTTTVASATASTTTVRPTTTVASVTTVRPVVVDGIPQVVATPSRAAVGSRVRIEGTGFTEDTWKPRDTRLWLRAPSGCGLSAEAQHTVTVSVTGRLTGEFVVPATGNCPQSSVGDIPLTSGTYRIVFMCSPCTIGQLDVTSNAVESVECADVGFAPNTDNVASDIVATGLDCAQAEALVRKAGAQLRSVGGPSRLDVDGFECVRTGQSDGPGLPSSTFACTSGVKKVTFLRT
jgi:hypothetical protein